MDHAVLKRVILEQHEVIRSMDIIPRDVDLDENEIRWYKI